MRRFLLSLVIQSLILTTAVAGTIRFAPLPLVDEKGLRAEYLPMLDYLGKKTGDGYQWMFMPKYPELLQAMINDRIDLAVLGPLPYIKLAGRAPHFEPLVHFKEKDGRTHYDCVLVAFGADRALKPRDIQGKRIGLTQPESTCGYFAVATMLKKAGRAPGQDGNRFEYAGNHTKAALGVVQGRYDIAGLKRNQAEKYFSLGLGIIAETGPYPAFALIANTRVLSAGQRAAIRDALLKVDPATLARWGHSMRSGAALASDADYRAMRRQVDQLGEIPDSDGS
jgi:phosphonate transport system substrate-binding protein